MPELSGRAEIRAEEEKKGGKNIVELENIKCYNYQRALSFFDLYLLVLSIFMNDEEKYSLHFVILHTSKDSFIVFINDPVSVEYFIITIIHCIRCHGDEL